MRKMTARESLQVAMSAKSKTGNIMCKKFSIRESIIFLRRGFEIEARDKNDRNATYTMADALFSACFLNSCLRNAADVEIACFSPIVNTRGAIFVHPDGIVKRTTFHTFKCTHPSLNL